MDDKTSKLLETSNMSLPCLYCKIPSGELDEISFSWKKCI